MDSTNSPRWTVCPTCDGEGYLSKIGAFTGADMDEWYGDDWDAREEFVEECTRRGGAYDEACRTCKGQRVVETSRLADIEQEAVWEAELAAESRWGC